MLSCWEVRRYWCCTPWKRLPRLMSPIRFGLRSFFCFFAFLIRTQIFLSLLVQSIVFFDLCRIGVFSDVDRLRIRAPTSHRQCEEASD